MVIWSNFVWGAALVLLGLIFQYGALFLRWMQLSPTMRKQYVKLPPGSLGLPFVGETLRLQRSLMSTTPHTFVNERRSRYGDLFLTHVFGSVVLASTDPEMSRFILSRDSLFAAVLPKSISMAVGKNALLNLRGEKHKRLRNLAMQVFSHDILKHHAAGIQKLASSQLKTWEGRRVLITNEARDFTFNVMLLLVLGLSEGKQSKSFGVAFAELKVGVRSLPINVPGTAYRKAMQAREQLKNMIERFVEERKRSEGQFEDLLNKLMHIHKYDEGEPLSMEEIVDQVLSTILAGFDTTSNTLIFLIYYMTQHPDVLHRVKKEHDDIVSGKEANEPITWNDYKKMELTQMAIKETLRLANPVLWLHRKTQEDVVYNGQVLPEGCIVQAWVRSIHTDPHLYPEPYNFDITRWQNKLPSKNFIPWGYGPRLCVGMELSRLELSLFVHCLLTTYSWELAEPDSPRFFPDPGMRKGFPIHVTELQQTN